METSYATAIALGIGIVAGLRSLTAPAAMSWAANLGWLNLQGTPLAFMGSTGVVALFSLAAFGEYVIDKLPQTPRRTLPPSLAFRVVTGGLSGASLCASAGQSLLVGALLGGAGGVIGGFAGYGARARLVRVLNVKDILIAIPEDLVAIGLAYFLMR